MSFVFEMFAEMIFDMFVDAFVNLLVPRKAQVRTRRAAAASAGSAFPARKWIVVNQVAIGRTARRFQGD